MVERIADMPPGTLGFRVSGRLTRAELAEQLMPPVLEAVAGGHEIRYLLQTGPGFEGLEPGALWEDIKDSLRLGMGHRSLWQRTALVTDLDWIRRAVDLLGWMAPGEISVFPPEDRDAAVVWVGE